MSIDTADFFRTAASWAQGKTTVDGQPVVGAFPSFFKHRPRRDSPTEDIYIVLALTDAQGMPAIVGDPAGIATADETDIPAVVRAANGVVRGSPRTALPTFTYGRRHHLQTMNLMVFRPGAVQRTTVPFPQLGISPADLNSDAMVRVVIAAVHRIAMARGHQGGFPTFLTVNGEAEVVFLLAASQVRIRSGGTPRPTWSFGSLASFVLPAPSSTDALDGGFAFLASAMDYDNSYHYTVYQPILVGEQRGSLVELSLDGATSSTIDARTSGQIGINGHVSALTVAEGHPAVTATLRQHVLYFDGTLRHASRVPGSAWTIRTVDGDGGANGHITAVVGAFNTLVDAGPRGAPDLHAFYYDFSNSNLRHAVFDGTNWTAETVDGDSDEPATGRINGVIGSTAVCATVEHDGTLHVFYAEYRTGAGTSAATFKLRHAARSGGGWRREQVDGNSASGSGTPPGRGPINASVGMRPSAVFWRDQLWVVYEDLSNANIRVATGARAASTATGFAWTFRALDGHSRTGGTVNTSVRGPRLVNWNDWLAAFYFNEETGNLRMAGRTNGDPNNPWFHAVVDGPATPGGARCGGTVTGIGAFSTRSVGRPYSADGVMATLPLALGYFDADRRTLRLAQLLPATF